MPNLSPGRCSLACQPRSSDRSVLATLTQVAASPSPAAKEFCMADAVASSARKQMCEVMEGKGGRRKVVGEGGYGGRGERGGKGRDVFSLGDVSTTIVVLQNNEIIRCGGGLNSNEHSILEPHSVLRTVTSVRLNHAQKRTKHHPWRWAQRISTCAYTTCCTSECA